MTARPFVKWAGGKTKLLPELLKHVPEEIGTYVEPFVGGGALFFELARQGRFQRAAICDANEELINAYIVIWRSLPALLVQLDRHKYEEKHYYEVRAQDPSTLSDVARAARFIFLNKTCFNGLYRVNRAGKFNVPFGKYTNPLICDADNLREVSKLLQGFDIEYHCGQFGNVFPSTAQPATGDDFIYCDPPYDILSENADFTSYTPGGFGWNEQEFLAQRAGEVRDAVMSWGCPIALSNADTPRIRELYKEWNLHEVKAERSINSKASKRGKVGELILT
jgi:DNA adenine methylase